MAQAAASLLLLALAEDEGAAKASKIVDATTIETRNHRLVRIALVSSLISLLRSTTTPRAESSFRSLLKDADWRAKRERTEIFQLLLLCCVFFKEKIENEKKLSPSLPLSFPRRTEKTKKTPSSCCTETKRREAEALKRPWRPLRRRRERQQQKRWRLRCRRLTKRSRCRRRRCCLRRASCARTRATHQRSAARASRG